MQNDPVNFTDPSGLLPCVPGEYGAECGISGFGGWGGGYSGGSGWGGDSRPGLRGISQAETRYDLRVAITNFFHFLPADAVYVGGLTWASPNYICNDNGVCRAEAYTFNFARHSDLRFHEGQLAFARWGGYYDVYGKLIDIQPQGVETDWDAQLLMASPFAAALRRSMAAAAEAEIGRKLDYLFGKATGSAHNIGRSTQMLRQLQSVGIFDTAANRAYLQNFFSNMLRTSGNITGRQAGGYTLREALLMGPNGALKVESVWSGNRLITVILYGGR